MENKANPLLSSPIAGCMRWGIWGQNFSTEEYRQAIDSCVANGITSFDHADIYGNYTTEAGFGKALKENKAIRSSIQIITKCGIQLVCEEKPEHIIKSYNTSAKHIIESVHQSLKNFGTDYIDVLLIHRPDPLLNPYEVARVIDQLKTQNKIVHFGVSNFLPHQVNMLKKYVQVEFNQLEISVIETSAFRNGILDNCLKHNIVPMAWAPLGGGIFSDDGHPNFRTIINAAAILAKEYNTGINQILIAFLTAHPAGIIPVLGTTKIDRLIHAKEATSLNLSREDWYKLYTACTGEEIA